MASDRHETALTGLWLKTPRLPLSLPVRTHRATKARPATAQETRCFRNRNAIPRALFCCFFPKRDAEGVSLCASTIRLSGEQNRRCFAGKLRFGWSLIFAYRSNADGSD